MSRRVLAVDLSNQIYRACHAHDGLRDNDGRFTGGLFGFLQSMTKAIERVGATDLVICRDSKPYLRSRDYPEYKQLRKKAADPELKERYLESEPLVLECLRELHVPIWAEPGLECDDLIAALVRRRRNRYEMICAMCGDSDLFQLFDADCFRMYKDAKTPIVTRKDFEKLFPGITCEEFITASAMAGTHNDIEGVPRVGVPTAIKILKGDPAKRREWFALHRAIVERNEKLIRLPHPETPLDKLPALDEKPGFNRHRLYEFLSRYDIQAWGGWAEAFDQVL